ncbi:MAG: hypothetical protein FWC21_01605 [Treponema sp.]|nr:hypothetical protein [Treponema sp.]
MKKLFVFIVFFFCGFALLADDSEREDSNETASVKKPVVRGPFLDWNLLFTGSWEESSSVDFQGNLNNRAEVKISILPVNLLVRGQILDRRVLNFAVDSFNLDNFFPAPEKDITNYTGGVYHKSTGSRLLFGVIDEAGLPARIRNPWIRSPSYAENRKDISADLRTTVSGTREDEAYLYLKSPFFDLSPDIRLRGFLSAQTEINEFNPAVSGGINFFFGLNELKLDFFYTGKTLPPSKAGTWFSYPPVLPERDFRLYAAGIIFSRAMFSVSSDFAFSEAFAWGRDIYANLGFSISPLLPFGTRTRPLLISFAFDAAGERFVFRDGSDSREGFRSAAKIEWRSRYSALYSVNLALRGTTLGEEFNRGSFNLYLRFPFSARNRADIIRLSSISFSADRNAVNKLKITDNFSASVRLRLSFFKFEIKSPFSLNFSGSLAGITSPDKEWTLKSSSAGCELTWSPLIFQLSARADYRIKTEKDDVWELSASAAARFKFGRISVKAASPDFPEKWNLSVSWRLEFP